jgi:hypothetical protein
VVRLVALTTCLLLASAAAARVMPLEPLPADKLAALPPLLLHGDVALIESHKDGTMKQVTLILFVAAPAQTVHEILTHPGEYHRFVPNVSRSQWQARPDGGVHSWRLELPVSSFENTQDYRFEPGPTGAVLIRAPEEKDDATYRWEMHAVTGGTVVVQYGYTDVKHSNSFVRSFLKRMPVTEHGLALAAQMMLASAIKREAERRTPAGTLPAVDKSQKSPGFGFLLERGQVAVMRSLADGRLGDVSLLDRVYAPAAKVVGLLARPGDWSKFVPGVDGSQEVSRSAGQIAYTLDFSVPLVTWSTRYAMRVADTVVEGAGTDGDLRGAHFRWDLTPRGPAEVLVVFRVNQRLTQGSVLFRKLIEHDHSLEHGLNVAFNLVYLRAIRGKAEGWGG